MPTIIEGTSGDDRFNPVYYPDIIINGRAGDDLFIGLRGDLIDVRSDAPEQFFGGSGSDTLFGGFGGGVPLDTFYGGLGGDSLYGGANVSLSYGDEGDDTILQEMFLRNKVYGGSGDDSVFVAIISEEIGGATIAAFGGAGHDRFGFYEVDGNTVDVGAGFDVDLVQGNATVGRTEIDLTGFEGAVGSVGNDTLKGGDGDVLEGLDGADALSFDGSAGGEARGGDGGDTLTGGNGADSLYGDAGRDLVYGGDGKDSIHAGDSGKARGLESLFGGAGDDTLFGDASSTATYFAGGRGDDVLRIGSLRDVGDDYYGGEGSDTASFSELTRGAVVIVGGAGTATFGANTSDFTSIENVTGTLGRDSITGGSGANRLNGHVGNDSLYGGGGNDTLLGDAGRDLLSVSAGLVSVFGGADDDRLLITSGISGGGTIHGGEGLQDVLEVTSSAGWVVDLGAEDLIEADNIVRITGVEWVFGGTGADRFTGNELANNLVGGRGDDGLYGGSGADTLVGSDGNDTLQGGADDDIFTIGTDGDNDVIDGGVGKDSLTLIGNFGWTLLSKGLASETSGQTTMDFSRIEVLIATNFADIVEEDGSLNEITLSQGDDVVVDDGVSSVDDIFSGGLGRDTLDLSKATGARIVNLGTETYVGNGVLRGFETVIGGAFNDDLTGAAGANRLSGQGGTDTLRGGAGDDSLFGGDGSDSILGGIGADSLDGGAMIDGVFGGDGNDTADGGTGADFLFGGGDTDDLAGGDGGDRLFGDAGNDTLLGNAGNDSLRGGAGRDVLTGDAGADDFVWAALADSGNGAFADVITDFATGEDDLDLRAIEGLTWIDTAIFSNVAGQVRQATIGTVTVISIDTDGNAVSDFDILLQSVSTGIVAGDLML